MIIQKTHAIADLIIHKTAVGVRSVAVDPALVRLLALDASDLEWFLFAYREAHEVAIQA
jgi:hypothetical protein